METLFTLPENQEEGKKQPVPGKARTQQANRQQIEMRLASLEDLLPEEHMARVVWAMVAQMDLSALYAEIQSVEGQAGRPAIDPRLLMAIWLYATLEGVGSARALERLCQEHLAYQWLLGGVNVNYHTLADFRVGHEQVLDELLTKGVAALLKEGVVSLDRTAQDGMKVRAHAGLKSFRHRDSLEQHLANAKEHVAQLKQQAQAETKPSDKRKQAAAHRAATERVERLAKALDQLEQLAKKKKKAHRKRCQQKEPRSSSTDPEARFLKQFDGGVRAGYNAQLTVDTQSGIIVGSAVINEVDQGQMTPMLDQLKRRYGRKPKEHLVDGGYVSFSQLEQAYQEQVAVYGPLPKASKANPDPSQPKASDTPGVKAWRARMSAEASKTLYKLRGATIEWANACIRNLGFHQVTVSGLKKVRAILLWFVLAHNLMRARTLRMAKA